MSNYAQKFVMPNAMLSLEYGTQFDRNLPYEREGNLQMAPTYLSTGGMMGTPWLGLEQTFYTSYGRRSMETDRRRY